MPSEPPIPADLREGPPPLADEDLDRFLERPPELRATVLDIAQAADEEGPESLAVARAAQPAEASGVAIDPAEAVREAGVARWEVEDDDAAEWAMRKLANARHVIEQAGAQADQWRAPIDAWEEVATASARRTAEFMEGRLAAYMLRRREETDHAVKSIPLPSGALTSKGATTAKVQVDDDVKLAAALREHLTEAELAEVVAVTESTKVYVTPLRNLVKIVEHDDGTRSVMLTDAGVWLPGVSIEDPTIQPTVTPR